MRYLTAARFGVLTAIATAILWIVVRFVLPLTVPLFLSRIGATQSGSRGCRRGHRFRVDLPGGVARIRRRFRLDALEAINMVATLAAPAVCPGTETAPAVGSPR